MSSQFTRNGNTYRIITERMLDGRLGRTLQRWTNSGWQDFASANHSASTRSCVICVDEVDAFLYSKAT